MTEQNAPFRSIILAGERPGGSALSLAFNIPASVLVPVAGKPCLQRVMDAIKESEQAQGGLIIGPTAEVLEQSEALQKLLQDPNFQWLEPATGPASSALLGLEKLSHYPALLTAGDHALLTGEIVDDFCSQAKGLATYDFVIGFVPYELVKAAWPESKRTVLKFSNGHPWRIARRFGPMALLRYLFRRLTLDDALQALSEASGCRIGYVRLEHARAAVDVDSIEDQQLAEKILGGIPTTDSLR